MQVHLNHKGPGHPWQTRNLQIMLTAALSWEPLVVVTQAEKDYLDGLALVLGQPIQSMLWADIPIDGNLFFTYVQIPNLNQGENECGAT